MSTATEWTPIVPEPIVEDRTDGRMTFIVGRHGTIRATHGPVPESVVDTAIRELGNLAEHFITASRGIPVATTDQWNFAGTVYLMRSEWWPVHLNDECWLQVIASVSDPRLEGLTPKQVLTLKVYCQTAGDIEETARRVHISARTVARRLANIREVTGVNDNRVLLSLAMNEYMS